MLHLYVDYERGIELSGVDGGKYKAYDHRERTWRHLNFFQHECYLHANVPRVKQADGTIQQVQVPWAAEGSSFTLLFEGYALALCKFGLILSATCAMLGVDSRVIRRIIRRYVTEALHTTALG